jgi:HK97 family phage major capsid protein
MSDATGRPIMVASPTETGQFLINGSPVVIASQMANVEPGSLPLAFGNWRQAYTMVNRRATTLVTDPFSAGYCTLYKFDWRIGAAVTCPNAVRLLRIR